MIELRPYQREAVDAACRALERGVWRPAIGLPTGTGKTIVFSKLIEERGGQGLILAHRDELLEQAADKFRQVVGAGADVGIVKAGRNDIDHQLVVASVQTLARDHRLRQLPRGFQSVVVDEAHHAVAPTYRKILDYLDETPLQLGVSATLERGDKIGLGDVWQEVVYFKTLMEMIEAGYLVDVRARSVKLNIPFGRLKVSHGDFRADEVAGALKAAHAESQAANAYLEHAGGRKAILFAPTVEMAYRFAAVFRAAGVPAEGLCGETPTEERRDIIRRLKTGETMVVCNAMVLTEGFDEPTVDCIIVARATRSRPLYVQMVGRGTRIYPGKTDLLVLDLVGNDERVDLVTFPKLVGLSADLLEERGASEVMRAGPPSAHQLAGLYDPKAHAVGSEEWNLFSRKDLNWLKLADGRWHLGTGDGKIYLEPKGDLWTAYLERWDREKLRAVIQVLGDGLDLGYAMGAAEEHVRELAESEDGARVNSLVSKSAPWRQQPPSDKQVAILEKNGIPIPGTKGEASDLLDGLFASRRTA